MNRQILICISNGKVWVQNKPAGIVVHLQQIDTKDGCIVSHGPIPLVRDEVYSRKHTVQDIGTID